MHHGVHFIVCGGFLGKTGIIAHWRLMAYYVRETRVGGLGYEGAGFRGSRAGP